MTSEALGIVNLMLSGKEGCSRDVTKKFQLLRMIRIRGQTTFDRLAATITDKQDMWVLFYSFDAYDKSKYTHTEEPKLSVVADKTVT